MEQVYMDIPVVRDIAKMFQQISEILQTVSKVLEMLSNLLKSNAFVGMVGGYALAAIIDAVKPLIDQYAQKCAELSKDVSASVDAYERGDQMGATRFY